MQLTIILTKEVEDIEMAQRLVDIIKIKLVDHPEIKMSSGVRESIE